MASKSLYHSELCKDSPVTLKVLSDELEGKYGPQVKVQLNGEERYLDVKDVRQGVLDGYKGQWVEITATGNGKQGNAEWDVREVDEPSRGRREEPRRQERRNEPARRDDRREEPRRERHEVTDEDRVKESRGAWLQARKFGNLLILCTEEARRVVEELESRSGEPIGFGSEEIQKLAVTIAIHCGQRVNVDRLPLELPPLKSSAAERKPARREPEPLTELEAGDEIEEIDMPF